MGFLGSGYRGLEGHLRTSLGTRLGGRFWGHSEAYLGPILDPYLRNLIISLERPSFGRG